MSGSSGATRSGSSDVSSRARGSPSTARRVLEWLRADADLSLDVVAERLAALSPRAAPTEANRVHQAKQYVKQLYRSLHDQGLLEGADLVVARPLRERRVERARSAARAPAEERVQPSFASSRRRRDGSARARPTFEVEGALRERLFAVKRGEVPIAEVLAQAEAMAPELEQARDASSLPRRPDVARADALLRRIGEEIARRHVGREPGPFGKDAPPPPEVVWSE